MTNDCSFIVMWLLVCLFRETWCEDYCSAQTLIVDEIKYECASSSDVGHNTWWVIGPSVDSLKNKNVVLKSSVSDVGSVQFVEKSAFSGRTGIISVTIPSSVIYIQQEAFYGCTALTKVVFLGQVTRIKQDAFSVKTQSSTSEVLNVYIMAQLLLS